jgi:hypothetical protein
MTANVSTHQTLDIVPQSQAKPPAVLDNPRIARQQMKLPVSVISLTPTVA